MKTLDPRKLALLCAALASMLCSGCNKSTQADSTANNAKDSAEVQEEEVEAERTPNHLANEKSAYLKAHALNPVDWYPWGEEALSRAKAENKIIFLSSGYSSCHWCHVMEKEVFSQDDVAEKLNSNFVCIKLDREERPDIDAIYMEALEVLNDGNVGWPMNVFLTPDLKPFWGATYIPKDEFNHYIDHVAKVWGESPAQINEPADYMVKLLDEADDLGKPGSIKSAIFSDAAFLAEGRYDHVWGGLKSSNGAKFPSPPIWQFMLRYYRKTGSPVAEKMLVTTLDNMARGGMRDQLDGGFHRYCVDESWTVPHFEKMLYDNAQLAGVYLEAGSVFKNEDYRNVARLTLDFMLATMSSNGSHFYASIDAQSAGKEGYYYVWTPEQVAEFVAEPDLGAVCALYGISPMPNFTDHDGKVSGSVLSNRADRSLIEKQFGIKPDAVPQYMEDYRLQLFSIRSQRAAPKTDTKIVTSWNGLAISAFAKGYRALGEPRYREAAVKTAEWLWKFHRDEDGSLVRASNDAEPAGVAVLDDYAFFALGMLDLYEATGDRVFLDRAQELVDYAMQHFRRDDAGFYLTTNTEPAPFGGRRSVFYDNVEPSGMAVMLDCIMRLAAFTGDEKRFDLVESDLKAFVPQMERNYINMAYWLDVAMRLEGPFYEVVIAGDPADPAMQQMLQSYQDINPSYAVLVRVPPEGASEDMVQQLPIVAMRKALDGKPTAYVCQRGSCKAPTQDPAKFAEQILDGWKK